MFDQLLKSFMPGLDLADIQRQAAVVIARVEVMEARILRIESIACAIAESQGVEVPPLRFDSTPTTFDSQGAIHHG